MRAKVVLAAAAVVLALALSLRANAAQRPRLVLFEGFLSTTCGDCQKAGQAMEQLAQEYAAAGKPVAIVEQNIEPRSDPRQTRFTAAYTGALPIHFPWIIVDGGHQVSNGTVGDATVAAYLAEYRRLVDAELARASRTEMHAYAVRIGDSVRVYATVQNLATALSPANSATVWGLVYEDVVIVPGANLTGRYVRGVGSQALTETLATGATASYAVGVTPVAKRPAPTATWQDSLDWSALHAVAFVDYLPSGSTGAYDMTQAAAAPVQLTLASDAAYFAIDAKVGTDWSGDLALDGPATLAWQATSDSAWLTVSPAPFYLPGQVHMSVDLGGLPAGGYVGHVTLAATDVEGMPVQQVVTVSGTYVTYAVYMPVVLH